MSEVSGRLGGLGGLRAFPVPVDSAPAPWAMCTSPDSSAFPLTYNATGGGRGAGRLALPVIVGVGKADDRSSWAKLLAFVSDTGPDSVIAALEVPDEYTAFDALQVTGFEIGEATLSNVVYLAATFHLDIVG